MPEKPAASRSVITLKVYDQQRLEFSTEVDGRLILGRQDKHSGEPGPVRRISTSDGPKLIVAGWNESSISRAQARIEVCPGNEVIVENISELCTIQLQTGDLMHRSDSSRAANLEPFQRSRFSVPVMLLLGPRWICLEEYWDELNLEALPNATVAPSKRISHTDSSMVRRIMDQRDHGISVEKLIEWIDGSTSVLQHAATSSDFLAEATKQAAKILQLDLAVALQLDDDQWQTVAEEAPGDEGQSLQPSRTMLERVRIERRTFRHVPTATEGRPRSLLGVGGLVASPILDRRGEVIGALYGDRRSAVENRITELEAQLFELITCGIAAGLARVEQERAAISARVTFEQFFTPQLARILETNPELLSGKTAEITILFCDIRRFSKIVEHLGPAKTVEWISDVMDELSECVIEHGGVLVDYIGDEIMAMWGAPEERPDHPVLACQAALEMVERLPILNQRWEDRIGARTDLGIGINTGEAYVGNTGSKRKFKYGPLGNTVNLASRVQGVTKYLDTRLLATASTSDRLTAQFSARRLCRMRVVNISEPFDLYELTSDEGDAREELHRKYDIALTAFESRDLHSAVRIARDLVATFSEDGPSRLLLSRVTSDLENVDGESFDPTWNLSSK